MAPLKNFRWNFRKYKLEEVSEIIYKYYVDVKVKILLKKIKIFKFRIQKNYFKW